MRPSKTNAAVFAAAVALGSMGLAACSSSSSTTPSAPATSEAPMTQAPSDTPVAAGSASYCEPLAEALAIKPPDGALDESAAAAYGEALVPVADAATADGNDDLAQMFMMMSQVYSDPNATNEQSGEVLNLIITNADEVNTACGIDLLQ